MKKINIKTLVLLAMLIYYVYRFIWDRRAGKLAVGVAVWHLSGERPAWVWLGVPVQSVLLAVFFAPVARLNGYALTGFTGALPYTWDMTLWAAGLTAARYLLLRLIAANAKP